jgi:hypothetical protein
LVFPLQQSFSLTSTEAKELKVFLQEYATQAKELKEFNQNLKIQILDLEDGLKKEQLKTNLLLGGIIFISGIAIAEGIILFFALK